MSDTFLGLNLYLLGFSAFLMCRASLYNPFVGSHYQEAMGQLGGNHCFAIWGQSLKGPGSMP